MEVLKRKREERQRQEQLKEQEEKEKAQKEMDKKLDGEAAADATSKPAAESSDGPAEKTKKSNISAMPSLDELNRPTAIEISDLEHFGSNLVDKHREKEGKGGEGLGVWSIPEEMFEKGTYINCDVRYYNLAALGKFDVVLIDPPWYAGSERVPCRSVPSHPCGSVCV